MSNKKELINLLYEQTLENISKNIDDWLKFLDCCSNNYKYQFNDQVLIFAQKPEAIACAELKIWNKVLKRWVNKGAKGIALIKEESGNNYLRYVFDLSDINGRKLNLWSVNKEYEKNIIESLELKFSNTTYKKDLPQTIIYVVQDIVQDNIQDYLTELLINIKNSNLKNVSEVIIKQIFENIVEKSVSYIILKRCGIDPLNYIKKEDFIGVLNYNTVETIIMLGLSITDMSRMCLKEIYNTIKKIEKSKKNINRTFEKNLEINYNKEKGKGSVENEYNIRSKRRLSDTEFSSREENKENGELRQVRQNEIELSKKEQEGNLYDVSSKESINRTFTTNTRNSNKKNSTNSRTDEETRKYNRRNEGTKSNGVGNQNEQYSGNSRTNSSERNNLQLGENNNKSLAVRLDNFFQEYDIFDTEEDNRTDEERIKDIEESLKNKVDISNTIKYLEEVKKSEDDYGELNKKINYYITELKKIYIKLEKEVEDTSFFDEKVTKLEDKNNYIFFVGDTIFIGTQEFTIANVDNEKMIIYDNQFPLSQKTVIINDILEKITENPMNDYLKDREKFEVDEVVEKSFSKWLDNFIKIKDIDLEKSFTIKENGELYNFKVKCVIEAIKNTTFEEQKTIKDMLIKVESYNENILDYLKLLARFSIMVENKHKRMIENGELPVDIPGSPADKEVIRQIIKNKQNIEYFDLHPEIPAEKRNNFKIRDEFLGVGTLKEKYKNNIEAIKVLKLCEEQNRYATTEEQQVLSKYVGWGGLKSVFDRTNNSWINEYDELKYLLTEEEYKNARASSVTAYYTPPIVIKNIYKALKNMGLEHGNILEPSCRNRKFFRNVTKRIR